MICLNFLLCNGLIVYLRNALEFTKNSCIGNSISKIERRKENNDCLF